VRPHSGPARGARQKKLATSQGDPQGYQGAEPLGWLALERQPSRVLLQDALGTAVLRPKSNIRQP
jgi:hypothetical protein